MTASRLWKTMGPVSKIPRKYSIAKIATLVFLSPRKLIISRKSERRKEEIKSKSREIESVHSPNT